MITQKKATELGLKPAPKLKLVFKGETPSLQETQFRLSLATALRTARNGTTRNINVGCFQWGNGVRAFCLFMVEYALHAAERKDTATFQFVGERKSPACSLDQALGKDGNSLWLMDAFGLEEKEGMHTNLYFLIHRDNPDGKRPNSPFLLEPIPDIFPATAISIILNDKLLISANDLGKLAQDLWKQWKGKPNVNPTPSLKAEASCSGDAPLYQAATEPQPVASVPDGALARVEAQSSDAQNPTAVPSIDDPQYWLKLVKENSVSAIRGTLLTALASAPKRDRRKLVTAVCDPVCITKYAEHLAAASLAEIIEFYSNRHGKIPRSIRQAVSGYISTDVCLLHNVEQTVMDGGYRSLFRWFLLAAHYCYLGIWVPGFEKLFRLKPNEDRLRNELNNSRTIFLPGLSLLIRYFREYGCFYAADKILALCLQNNYAVIRKSLDRENGRLEWMYFHMQICELLSEADRMNITALPKKLDKWTLEGKAPEYWEELFEKPDDGFDLPISLHCSDRFAPSAPPSPST